MQERLDQFPLVPNLGHRWNQQNDAAVNQNISLERNLCNTPTPGVSNLQQEMSQ